MLSDKHDSDTLPLPKSLHLYHSKHICLREYRTLRMINTFYCLLATLPGLLSLLDNSDNYIMEMALLYL